jgi:alpha-L-fucosidase
LVDTSTGAEVARFAEGHSLACAIVHDATLYVFASRFENNDWNDVTLFKSPDLVQWEKKVVVTQTPNEHLFNSSVCEGPDGFVMAYETNDPAYPAFTTKFARSSDLDTWTKAPDALLGTDRYTACPAIRYADGYYYVLYTEHRKPRWFFEVYAARSRDLATWQISPVNPVLTPDAIDDGIDASDPDLVEFDGNTILYYAVGDQRTWMNIKRAIYRGSMREFLARWFPPGIEEVKCL